MGAWKESPAEWPMGMPSPDSDGWPGWARHWLAAHALPLWLNEAAVEHKVRLPEVARLAWRLRAREAASLERSVEGGTLQRSLRDAGLPEAVVEEVAAAVEGDLTCRRRILGELAAIGPHLGRTG